MICKNSLCNAEFIPTKSNHIFCKPACSKRQSYDEIRKRVFALYGSKCECCEETGLGFLTLNHINNDGCYERRALKVGASAFYYLLADQPKRGDLEILCFNCNTSRYHNRKYGGRCQHEIDRENAINGLIKNQQDSNELMVPTVQLDEIYIRQDQ